jgi:hypothetical protein
MITRLVFIAILLAGSLSTTASAQVELLPEHFQFESDVVRNAAIPSPATYLGYETGQEYTMYADVVGYIKAVAAASDRVSITEYARTYENRPLFALFVTSPENHARLDEIQAANLKLADPATSADEASTLIENNPIVTWLSYNVHGNEPSSTESAMEVLYLLASGQSPEIESLLRESVVVIDPTINPDGRDRYVYWYKSMQSNVVRENSADLEHTEPFPGGRTNHYWFDLNRDWVWLVHPESQGRIALYQEWLPQVHMDYHEQGFNNNYFTMPGKAPRNLNLPKEYDSWADVFGRASGEALARNQVNYFTRESFEFFYPGYGSSYPSILGAIGMLSEQGGHSRGGRAVKTNDGYILTLRQRAFDHFATSMAIVRSSVEHRSALLTYFREFFNPATTNNATKAYLLREDHGNGYVTDVIELLMRHGVEIHRSTESFTTTASDYWDASEDRETFEAGTYIIQADQARHVLVNTLMQRQMEIESWDMYDMSTWSIPLAYNLDAAWTKQAPRVAMEAVTTSPTRESGLTREGSYAYVIDWRQRTAPKALARLWDAGYKVRSARKTFAKGSEEYSIGSLIILKGRNRDKAAHFEDDMRRIAREAGVHIVGFDDGRMDTGIDLASASARPVARPDVAMLLDAPFSSETAGQLWYLFDQRVEFGIDRIRAANFNSLDLDEYEVLILPPAYGSVLDSMQVERVKGWVRKGGTLIGSESTAAFLTKGRSGITSVEMAKAEKKDDKDKPVVEERFYTRYEARSDSSNTNRVSGSAFRAVIDNSHPLAAGMKETMYTLKFGSESIAPSSSFQMVGHYDRDAASVLASGFASDENKKKIAGNGFAGVSSMGAGKVIFLLDKTQYRMFWMGPTRMIQNAVMLMPGM